MNNEIDWSALPFGYLRTDYNVRCEYRDGKWGEIQVSSDETINVHMAATTLHYGQESSKVLKRSAARTTKSAYSGSRTMPDECANQPKVSLWNPYPKICSARCAKRW